MHALAGLFLVLALGACSQSEDRTGDDQSTGDPTGSAASGEQSSGEINMHASNGNSLSLEEAVQAAREALAERSGTPIAAIETVRARAVTWANGAMGCPQEGMMYTQALVEGYYILLRTEGREVAYHAGRDGRPFHCPAERSRAPSPDDRSDSLS